MKKTADGWFEKKNWTYKEQERLTRERGGLKEGDKRTERLIRCGERGAS